MVVDFLASVCDYCAEAKPFGAKVTNVLMIPTGEKTAVRVCKAHYDQLWRHEWAIAIQKEFGN